MIKDEKLLWKWKFYRKYIGIDISEEFLEISKSRIEEINEGQLEITLDFINIISIDNTNEKNIN